MSSVLYLGGRETAATNVQRHLFRFCRRRCVRNVFIMLALVALLDLSGLHRHLLERDFYTEFEYPQHGNVAAWVQRLMEGRSLPPAAAASRLRQFEHRIELSADGVCRSGDNVSLLIVVKSAAAHFDRRQAIRQTWCDTHRFGRAVQCVFALGMSYSSRIDSQARRESSLNADIVSANFHDNYFNNTLKMMASFRWVRRDCPGAEFVLFVDDDFYVSVPNTLLLLRPPLASLVAHASRPLLLGYVFHSAPHRHKFSKWFVSLDEYPFSLWPPYCTAGAFIVSRDTLARLLFASRFVKQFRFDDIYVGLLAKKVEIRPQHTSSILFWTSDYDPQLYRHLVAAHGFSDVDRLRTVWRDQHQRGFA